VNDPHTAHAANDTEMKTTTVDSCFGEFLDAAYRVWQDGSLSDPDKGNEIRRLALVALANRDNEDDDSHTDGPAIRAGKLPNTQGRGIGFDELESDARLLTGCAIVPRKMSREELQAAADRLTGPRTREDDILEAIKRREAKHLLSQHGGYHQ